MPVRYFKLVALHDDPSWLASEFRAGRVRFGWSWPGCDLRVLRKKSNRSADERISWRYTQFLTERLRAGDWVVCQFDQPLREFWIGEILEEGYEFDTNGRKDFNHILNVRPLTEKPVSMTSVSYALRHDLTKRGQYYEIYPEQSVRELTRIVDERLWDAPTATTIRTEEHEFVEWYSDLQKQIISSVSERWKAKDFEVFCERLCESIPYVEVKTKQDTKQGWDMLVRILNPVTGEPLLDDVPVQCKNFQGKVHNKGPIEDLERCIRNSNSHLAYLFILGELSDEFRRDVDRTAERLSEELGRRIELVLVDESRIADLCLQHKAGQADRANGENG